MFNRFLNLIKKTIPKAVFKKLQPAYHFCLACLANFFYNQPSKKMIIVGVTGTSGKSSTCYFIAQTLEHAGLKVGMTTTTLFKIRHKEWLNKDKMTMLGRFGLQRFLKKCLQANCQLVIIETSSQGIAQFRHLGIAYDILVFTNLYPEHIEAHGSFDKYKQAKAKLFKYLSHCPNKNLDIKVQKTIIANLDDEHADYFLNFTADKKIGFSRLGQTKNNLKIITDNDLKINLLGDYNRYNVLAAVAVAQELNLKMGQDFSYLKPLPGRLEFIANNRDIKILVDYAFEPKAVEKLYETIKKELQYNKIIHVLGSAGGGRDKARRPILGKLAAVNADIIIITNEDPYDESPQQIIDQVATGAMGGNFQFPNSNFQTILNFQIPKTNKQLFAVLDRRQAIVKALELAHPGDLVLVTGKGAEQAICLENGKMEKWDDRQVIREELKNLKF